jgi:mono/diheme cytochrome c family protein
MRTTDRGFPIKTILLFALAAGMVAATWYVVSHGFSARNEPSSIEAFIARHLRLLAIPKAAKQAKNPVPPDPKAMEDAMAHFADHCAFCHANDGSGKTAIGRGLYPKPPDMREAGTQNLTDGEIYYIIQNGVRFTGMPAFGDAGEEDEDSWKLVQFIRRLPNLTDEELGRMKSMNPKTPAELKREEEIQRFLRGEDAAPQEDESHQHHH